MFVLVTGGAGYVGAVLVRHLVEGGGRVRVLDALRRPGHGPLDRGGPAGLEFLHGDLRDRATVERAVEGVDAIVHLAAVVGYPACAAAPEVAVEINVGGTEVLLNSRTPDQRLVLASTSSVYAPRHDRVLREDGDTHPISVYGTTKLAAEELVRAAPNTAVLRFTTGFGVSPTMRFDLLTNALVYDAVVHRRIRVFESAFRRSFVHVDDMAAAVQFALDRWSAVAGGVFNVGDERLSTTKGEIARRIADLFVADLEIGEFGRDAERRDQFVSFEKFARLGFRPTADLDRALMEIGVAARLLDGEPQRR